MCEHGTTSLVNVKVPADLSHTGAERWSDKPIDACIADLVRALQQAGIDMRASCCGHDRADGEILLQDGRVLIVRAALSAAPTTDAPRRALNDVTDEQLDVICQTVNRLPIRVFMYDPAEGRRALRDALDIEEARLTAAPATEGRS